MSQEILEKLDEITGHVVRHSSDISEIKSGVKDLKADMTEVKENQAWMMERLSSVGALQYQLNDYGRRIDKLEMRATRRK